MEVLALGLCRTGKDCEFPCAWVFGVPRLTDKCSTETGSNDTYHGYKAALGNPRDCELWYEAFRAKYDGIGKLFGLEDFDQLLGNCQAVCDFPPAALLKELVEAYPEAKAILTDRDVDKWA